MDLSEFRGQDDGLNLSEYRSDKQKSLNLEYYETNDKKIDLSSYSSGSVRQDDPARNTGRFAYHKESGIMGNIAQWLDYFTNYGRSSVYAAITPDMPRQKGESYIGRIKRFGEEALARKRYISSREVRRKYINNISRLVGDGKTYAIGEDDDGKTTVGDWADTAMDFTIDVLFDPMTWATFGTAAALKTGMKGYKYLPQVMKVTKDVDAANKLKNTAMVYTGVKAALRGTLGATAGLQFTNPRDSAAKQAAAALVGAGIGIASPNLLRASGKQLKRGAVTLSDKLALMKGEQFKNFSKHTDIATKEKRAVQSVQDEMVGDREKILEKLSIPERIGLHDNILDPLRDFTVNTRNGMLKQYRKSKEYRKAVADEAMFLESQGAKTVQRDLTTDEFASFIHKERNDVSLKGETLGIKADYKEIIDDVSYAQIMTAAKNGMLESDPKKIRELALNIVKDIKDAGVNLESNGVAKYMDDIWHKIQLSPELVASKINRGVKDTEGLGKAIKESRWYNLELYNITERANKMAHEEARRLLKDHSADVAQSLREMVKLNRKHVAKMNKELNVIAGVNIRGLDYHIPRLFAKKPQELLEKTSPWDTVHAAKETMESKEYHILTEKLLANKEAASHMEAQSMARDLLYNVYARQEAMRFVPEYAKESMKLVSEYHKGKHGVLQMFDGVSNHIKKGQLYATYTWLRTNLFDNVGKSFTENGFFSALDAGMISKMSKNIREDVKTWLDPAKSNFFNDPQLMKEGHDYGLLDSNFFKYATHPDTRHLVIPPSPVDNFIETLAKEGDLEGAIAGLADDTSKVGEYLQVHAKEAKRQSALSKAGKKLVDANNWVGDKLENTVGRFGSTMENTGKLALYKRVRDDLLDTKQFAHLSRDEINKIAAKVSLDTFFDYSKISHIENEIAHRMFFYWAFHVKNQAYWMKKMTEPEMLQRWNVLMKARNTIGDPSTSYQKEGLDPYIRERDPRYLGRDGRQHKFFVRSNSSSDDAMRNLSPSNWKQSILDKTHPVAKLMAELAFNYDSFTDTPLLPSSLPKGKKYTFSASSKYGPLMEYDKRGNPYTRSDAIVILDKFLSTFFPHGAINSVAGNANKTLSGRQTLSESAVNEFSPYSTISVPAFKMHQNRQLKKKN